MPTVSVCYGSDHLLRRQELYTSEAIEQYRSAHSLHSVTGFIFNVTFLRHLMPSANANVIALSCPGGVRSLDNSHRR